MNRRFPLIKICGLTRPEDAEFGVSLGADMIGMIFVEGSKRKVSKGAAKEIVEAAKEGGAIPVGVFTSGSVDFICQICQEINITCVQLYEPLSKVEFEKIKSVCTIICAMGVGQNGKVRDPLTLNSENTPGDFLLFDSKNPGSGKKFNWNCFTPPDDRPWILAGGLNPENVREAIDILKPSGVDVSSGIESNIAGRKDRALLKRFIEEVKRK